MADASVVNDYRVLRFVPDLATGEFRNVGIVLLSRSEAEVVVRVPELPDAFAKVPPLERGLLSNSLGQFLEVLGNPEPDSAGTYRRPYDDELEERVRRYSDAVRAPLALSAPQRCGTLAPRQMVEMLYSSLVKPPVHVVRPHSRVDYEVRDRLLRAGVYGDRMIRFNASVRTLIGIQPAKLGYSSVKGQMVVSPVNFTSKQSMAEATRAYMVADLVNDFERERRVQAHTIAAFRRNGQDAPPAGFNLLVAGHQHLIDLDARDSYYWPDPRRDGARVTVLDRGSLEDVVAASFDAIHVPETLDIRA